MANDFRRDYNISERERAEIRRKWMKYKKRNKIKKLAILVLLAIMGLAIILAVVFGVIKLVKAKQYENVGNTLKSDVSQLQLVENEDNKKTSSVSYIAAFEATEPAKDPDIETTQADKASPSEVNTYTGESKGLVILDAGHGGYDGGATCDNGLEKDINLSLSLKAKEELVKRGYDVFLTRPEDEFVGLNKRAELANNQSDALCMVSIHQNSVDGYPEVSGIEAWTYERGGCIELAEILVNKVSEATGAKNRGSFFRTNLVVTSKTTMPSVIIECGYLSNPDEALLLTTDDYQRLIVNGIADSVEEFISTYY